jgi:triosephosphate isomerase
LAALAGDCRDRYPVRFNSSDEDAKVATRKPVVGGNWKMNTTGAEGVGLAGAIVAGAAGRLASCEVVLCPPFPYLTAIGDVLRGSEIRLGAQNVHPAAKGAFTGEVSTGMLRDLGVDLAIVGHSERRHVFGEEDAFINEKARAALAAGLDVILCVGETREQRGRGETEAVVVGQLRAGLEGIDGIGLARVVIAYEPVWAIGTGDTATPEDAQAVHAILRESLEATYDARAATETRIQYGGSVKPGNAAELIAQPDIDGFLVGGASLVTDDFLAIVRAAAA